MNKVNRQRTQTRITMDYSGIHWPSLHDSCTSCSYQTHTLNQWLERFTYRPPVMDWLYSADGNRRISLGKNTIQVISASSRKSIFGNCRFGLYFGCMAMNEQCTRDNFNNTPHYWIGLSIRKSFSFLLRCVSSLILSGFSMRY